MYHQLVHAYFAHHIHESRMNMNARLTFVKQTRYSKKMVHVKHVQIIHIEGRISVCNRNVMGGLSFKKMGSVDTVTITLTQNHYRGEDVLMIDILASAIRDFL